MVRTCGGGLPCLPPHSNSELESYPVCRYPSGDINEFLWMVRFGGGERLCLHTRSDSEAGTIPTCRYPSDDINKFLWMVRIGGGVFPEIKEKDYIGEGSYRVDDKVTKVRRPSRVIPAADPAKVFWPTRQWTAPTRVLHQPHNSTNGGGRSARGPASAGSPFILSWLASLQRICCINVTDTSL